MTEFGYRHASRYPVRCKAESQMSGEIGEERIDVIFGKHPFIFTLLHSYTSSTLFPPTFSSSSYLH